MIIIYECMKVLAATNLEKCREKGVVSARKLFCTLQHYTAKNKVKNVVNLQVNMPWFLWMEWANFSQAWNPIPGA